MRNLKVVVRALSELKPYPGNARKHSSKHIKQIARSIETFDWTLPILVDDSGMIIAGHGRLEAAKFLGLSEVPTIALSDLTEAQVQAYGIADNRLAELAEWDDEILAQELKVLSDLDLDFELPVIGFELPEIDVLIQNSDVGDSDDDSADRVPAVYDRLPPVSRFGDLWILGSHRLLCGDARELGDYEKLLAGQQAGMVFADPPYNVPIAGHVCGLGSVSHAEFAMAAGEMSESAFITFLQEVLSNMALMSRDGSLHYICMDWRHTFELLTAGKAVYHELKNLCVWNKTNGGMGSLYRSKHELVLVYKRGTAPHVNNVELGKHGRYRTNVWDYPGVNSLRAGRLEDLKMHPTVKPVALVADAILDASKRGDFVLDPFSGSGTTLIAAEKAGRRGAAMEFEPHYVDTAIRRWQSLTGDQAIHAENGLAFDDLEAIWIGIQTGERDMHQKP